MSFICWFARWAPKRPATVNKYQGPALPQGTSIASLQHSAARALCSGPHKTPVYLAPVFLLLPAFALAVPAGTHQANFYLFFKTQLIHHLLSEAFPHTHSLAPALAPGTPYSEHLAQFHTMCLCCDSSTRLWPSRRQWPCVPCSAFCPHYQTHRRYS